MSSERRNIDPASVSLIVQRVSRFVPGALCLAQAVSAQRILARFGFQTIMRIGVKSEATGELEAHAWLVCDDRVILGGNDSQLRDYKVITDMQSATAL